MTGKTEKLTRSYTLSTRKHPPEEGVLKKSVLGHYATTDAPVRLRWSTAWQPYPIRFNTQPIGDVESVTSGGGVFERKPPLLEEFMTNLLTTTGLRFE